MNLKGEFLLWKKILLFKADEKDFQSLSIYTFLLGVLATWIVGVGRWWDNVDADPLKKTGIGSVAYIFVLSQAIWWVNVWFTENKNYFKVLTFVSLTSVPAILYAFPIEIVAPEYARTFNVTSLLVVSIYRVSLMASFLRQYYKMKWSEVITSTLFMLSGIVTIVFISGLGALVLDAMGGFREKETKDALIGGQTFVNALAQKIGTFAFLSLPITFVAYYFVLNLRYKPRNWI